MKTPKEFFLDRHQSSVPKLDALRRAVIARHCASAAARETPDSAGFLDRLWLELVLPCRQIWIGLAAVWVLLSVINLTQRDASPEAIAKSARTAEMMLALRNQESLLDEPASEHPRAALIAPRPRSQVRSRITTV